jgi:C4-dicarboxylate-specific signal transduction histidine kinase
MRSPCGSARPLDFMATNDDDLTAKVARLEEQVRQTQKLEALGQLSAGIAHNFNNMLAAIVPVLELAKQRVEADVDLFEQALQSASRAADLVKDLMFFSRRSADPHRVQEPLETVVRRATELCVRTFGQLVHVELGDLRAAERGAGRRRPHRAGARQSARQRA